MSARALDVSAFNAARPPVVLLGGLNVLRALGLARIPAIVASPDPDATVLASRYCAAHLALPPLERREAVLDTLLGAGERLARALGRPVPLFYCNDDALDLVQSAREPLARLYRLLLNDPLAADAMIDKERFFPFASRRGLPVPRQLEWASLERFDGAVIVKPKTRIAWDESPIYRRLFGGAGKARVFASGAAVRADAGVAQLAGELAFQEYLEGDDRDLWSFHGFAAEDGEVLAWFIGRKIRTWPALTGYSSYVELARDDKLAALGCQVAARVPLKGPFKLDFKRDRRSGRFALLEVNARFNLWHYPAAKSGINLPQVAYDYLVHGEKPAAIALRRPCRWLAFKLDWRAFRELRARRQLGWAGWLWSLASAPKVYELFAWTDPLPFLRHWAMRLARIPRRLTLRVWRWLSTAS
jgi:predicted ATP-grasp superfamily ATP-dependent carboligase